MARWAFVLLLAGCGGKPAADPRLETPVAALNALESRLRAGPVCTTPEGAAALQARGIAMPDPAGMARVFTSPEAFRAMDRQRRFGCVFLAGSPAGFRPLLQYLAGTEDWTLVYLDHQAVAFARRDAAVWDVANLDVLRGEFPAGKARSRFLAGAGGMLLELGRAADARACMESALKEDPANVAAEAGLAAVLARDGAWDRALAEAERALKRDPTFPGALYVKGQSLYALRRSEEARAISTLLTQRFPTDPQYLLLHAKTCHEAGDLDAEIAALEKIIGQIREQGGVPGGYRMFLGQAFAAKHRNTEALKEFEGALAEGGLTRAQTEHALLAVKRFHEGGAAEPNPPPDDAATGTRLQTR